MLAPCRVSDQDMSQEAPVRLPWPGPPTVLPGWHLLAALMTGFTAAARAAEETGLLEAAPVVAQAVCRQMLDYRRFRKRYARCGCSTMNVRTSICFCSQRSTSYAMAPQRTCQDFRHTL